MLHYHSMGNAREEPIAAPQALTAENNGFAGYQPAGRGALDSRSRHFNSTSSTTTDHAILHMARELTPHHLNLRGRRPTLCFRHDRAAIDQLTLHFTQYSTNADRVEIVAPELGEDLLVKLPISGKAEVVQGNSAQSLQSGDIYIARPNMPYRIAMSGDYSQLTLQVNSTVLKRALNERLGRHTAEAIHFDRTATGQPGAARVLSGLIGTICNELNSGDSMLKDQSVQRTFQDALVSMLLNLPHNFTDRLQPCESPAAPYYVKRTEEFMRENLMADINMDDLVRTAGVSRRSLYAGFRRFRGTSPMTLLKNLRLDAAYDDLLQTDGRTITQVATGYGFFHLSKFSSDFRKRFGRLPSDVLRRAQ